MIYIGNFLHVSSQEDVLEENRRHGGFNLIVEAENYEEALEKFKMQILKLRSKKDFFEGQCAIYFTHLFEFDHFPRNEAMMLNFKSIAGDPVMPFIGCSLPTDQADACRVFDWQENIPKIDGDNENVFMQFSE